MRPRLLIAATGPPHPPLCVLAALSLLLAVPAEAQWPTTSWTLRCSMGLDAQVECENRDRFPYGDAATFHAAQLSAASVWLQGLGFAAPHVTGRHGDSFMAEVTDRGTVHTLQSLALYSPGRIDFNAARLIYPGYLVRPPGSADTSVAVNTLGTGVHELFHAVQAGELTPDGYTSAISSARRWINEATAEAVMAVWLEKNPPLPGQAAAFEEHYYDHRLDGDSVSYEAWHFWRSLGTELGARDDIEYLKDLYDPALVGALTADDRGTGWVHEALKRHHDGGLYHFYPTVIAGYADDEAFYENPLPVELSTYQDVVRNGRVEPLASEAFVVRVQAPGATLAGLSVELDEPHRNDPALHLVVDAERYDTPGEGAERNVFRTAIDPAEGERTFLVRVANVAENPAESAELDYTLRFSLQPSTPCSPDVMMSAVRGEYWNDQQSFNEVFDAAQRTTIPHLLPDGRPVVVEFVRPADEYLTDFEPQAALHPAEGTFALSGLVQDEGTACTEPLGTNSMRAIIHEAETDPEAYEQHAEEAAESLVERIQQMSPEELAAMRESGMDAMRRMLTPSQGGESMLGMGQEALEESMGASRDRPVLIRLFSPNAFAWQSDLIGAGRAVEHGGLGGWKPNAEAQMLIELRDVGAAELRERAEPYRARLFTWAPDAPVPLYARWDGEEQPTGDAAPPYLLSELAFQGTLERLEATTLSGRVWITEITGAEVRGRFEMTGEGTLTRTTTVFDLQDGVVVGERVVDREEERGPVSFQGTFSAPAALEFDRAGRVITRTFQIQ